MHWVHRCWRRAHATTRSSCCVSTPLIWYSEDYWMHNPSISCCLGDSWHCIHSIALRPPCPISDEFHDDTLGFREVLSFRGEQQTAAQSWRTCEGRREWQYAKFHAFWCGWNSIGNRHLDVYSITCAYGRTRFYSSLETLISHIGKDTCKREATFSGVICIPMSWW